MGRACTDYWYTHNHNAYIEIRDLYSNAVMRDGDVCYPTRIGLGII